MTRKVERTRNGGKMTEAEYWSKVRSALRKSFAWWAPAQTALKNSRRENQGEGRHKFEYECAVCGKWLTAKEVQADHVVPVGSLKSLEDLAGFLERLTPEDPESFQCVCKECHKAKTRRERRAR